MIIYISESLNSKKDGGSSLSGADFLNILCSFYNNVIVISNDDFSVNNEMWYNMVLNKPISNVVLKRNYNWNNLTLRDFLKNMYFIFQDFFKKKSVNLDVFFEEDGLNVIYVNSWSNLFLSNRISYSKEFSKTCVVRGNPESFVYQSIGIDKNQEVFKASRYLLKFDSLIYVSSKGKEDWGKILFPNIIDSYYLPNSIDEVEVNLINSYSKSEVRKKMGVSNVDYNIVIVGSVQTRKGQDILIQIMPELIKFLPNVKFHIVGGVSTRWGGNKIFQDISNSIYSHKFKFYGHSNKVLDIVYSSDICLFTSRGEAFPRAVAEYMALGQTIIAPKVSGIPEMIEHNISGLLYDINNPLEIVNLIKYVLDNPNLASNLAKNARQGYYNKFAKNLQILRAHQIFNSLSNKFNTQLN